MFKNLVTLFNYDETDNKYYTTSLENIEFQPNYKTEFNSYSTESKDLSLLIVKYGKDPLGKFVIEDSAKKYFLTPKKWSELDTSEKPNYFTLEQGRDFFVKDNVPEYYETYEEVKNDFDEVFMIHSVKDFEDDLKHWEIEGY